MGNIRHVNTDAKIMTGRFTLLFLVCAAAAAQVAEIDLSVASKIQPLGPASAAVRGGKVLTPNGPYIPAHIPLSLSIKLLGFTKSSNPATWSAAVEVAVTNTGTEPLRLPAGTDRKLLAPGASSRRLLDFGVLMLGAEGERSLAGSGRAASNADQPESSVELLPGDYVVYKVEFDTRAATRSGCAKSTNAGGCRISVAATLGQKTLDRGLIATSRSATRLRQ